MIESADQCWARRRVLQVGVAAVPFWLTAAYRLAAQAPPNPKDSRPLPAMRKFTSPVIEEQIALVAGRMSDPELARIFRQCLPNTLDTTVFTGVFEGKPDTYIITGDIDALWLRDSSAQVWPYLAFARQDAKLRMMLEGLVRRHARMVMIDAYANAFTHRRTDPPLKWARADHTEKIAGVAERKWEVDSLCYVIRHAHGFWKATGDVSPYDDTFHKAAWKIVRTFREQQRRGSHGPYSFQRLAENPTDSVPLSGYGNPARPCGLLFSMFRPSDDACIYPLFIPANMFAASELKHLAEMAHAILRDEDLAREALSLSREISEALEIYGAVQHPQRGKIWAYEVDGYGNTLMMDDANAPGLLSLAYLGCCAPDDPVYRSTRRFVLSDANPYFFKGTAAEGLAARISAWTTFGPCQS